MKTSSVGRRGVKSSKHFCWLKATGVVVAWMGLWVNSGWALITPEVANGSMTGPVGEMSAAPGWTVANSTPDVVDANGPFNNTGVNWILSPDGGQFARLNGDDDPTYREAIQQTITGFTIGESYTLEFYQTNLGFYYTAGQEWRRREGYLDFYINDVLVGQSTTINAPLDSTDSIVWLPQSISFTASDNAQTLRIVGRTAEANTAYMAIDGVRLLREICDNGVDDDGDTLVDQDDEDCNIVEPFADLLVRCIHEPLWPQLGDVVTIRAEAANQAGQVIQPDLAEIFIDDLNSPNVSVVNQNAVATFTADREQFSYGCRVAKNSKTAQSWRSADTDLRAVDVGSANNPTWEAIPIIYSGRMSDRIDIVFFADDDEYNSASDPNFLADVYTLINEGYFTIPWFTRFQWMFNFWIATDNSSDASPTSSDNALCKNVPPEDFKKRYAWAEGAGIVHRSVCRDNARGGVFTIEMEATRIQVVAHETGHAVFGFADEYCCDGGYFSSKKPPLSSNYKPPYPNMFKSQDACRDDAVDRPYSPSACRSLTAKNESIWWLGEPDYGSGVPQVDEIRDLMQGTGGVDISSVIYDRYQVGDSERDRMSWLINECLSGGC